MIQLTFIAIRYWTVYYLRFRNKKTHLRRKSKNRSGIILLRNIKYHQIQAATISRTDRILLQTLFITRIYVQLKCPRKGSHDDIIDHRHHRCMIEIFKKNGKATLPARTVHGIGRHECLNCPAHAMSKRTTILYR